MEYNTSRNHLNIPEYGRNIQKMIEHAIGIEDREERNAVARSIVDVMGQLNPSLRDITDFKHKLWDHLFIISDFKLDVDSPYPIPSADTIQAKPQRVKYPNNHIRYKHYGKTIENIISEIKKLEDSPEKDDLIAGLANFMKMSYLTHNRDTVNDELIMEHLEELSNGELKLGENVRLQNTNDILSASKVMRKPPENKKNNRISPRKNNNNNSQNKSKRPN